MNLSVQVLIEVPYLLLIALNQKLILFFPARDSQNLSEDDADAKLRQFHLPVDLMPVMVWFHGGGYVRGGSSQFGPQFLMREGHDVVLVTVNYRLGVFGNAENLLEFLKRSSN